MLDMYIHVIIYDIDTLERVPEITLNKKSEEARLKTGFFLICLLECF